MLRSNLLFIHVLSAMAMFTMLGMEALGLTQVARATDLASARAALLSLRSRQRGAGLSLLVLFLSGAYLARVFWQWKGAWIGLGLLGLLLLATLGALVSGRTVGRLRAGLERGGDIASIQLSRPRLQRSLVLRLALLVAIVYLMTVKPG